MGVGVYDVIHYLYNGCMTSYTYRRVFGIMAKVTKRAVGKPDLLQDTAKLYDSRAQEVFQRITVLPGVESQRIDNRIAIHWYADEDHPEWGKVAMHVNLTTPLDLSWIETEKNHKVSPPLEWDHWKFFGIPETSNRERASERLGELYRVHAAGSSQRRLTDIAYGRIVSDLWFRGQKGK
jgi:hypothetical protein